MCRTNSINITNQFSVLNLVFDLEQFRSENSKNVYSCAI
jgi:hypothetical protein